MKKYRSFFRIRFFMGIQYRVAALAGVVTQFAWGFMEIMVYIAFYRTNAAAFPMTMASTASYIWLQQAFLVLFAAWLTDSEILDAISGGGVVYELCRPVDLYFMWFVKCAANRLSGAFLRFIPVIVVALFLPQPYGLLPPAGIAHAALFAVTLILGVLVTISVTMLVYVLTFFTMSSKGLQTFSVVLIDFLSGGIIPIPFFPDWFGRIVELLPFGAMQNIPFRVYSADIAGAAVFRAVCVQVFWIFALIGLGKFLCRIALRRVKIQGG